MAREGISRIKIELTRLFEQQVERFRKRNISDSSPAERRGYQKRRERVQKIFAAFPAL